MSRAAVAAGCVYELAALGSGGRLPTITALTKSLGRHRLGRFAFWLVMGFVVDHFNYRETEQ